MARLVVLVPTRTDPPPPYTYPLPPASPGSIPDYWIWGYYISPFAWALRCVVINEFTSQRWGYPSSECGRGSVCCCVCGGGGGVCGCACVCV